MRALEVWRPPARRLPQFLARISTVADKHSNQRPKIMDSFTSGTRSSFGPPSLSRRAVGHEYVRRAASCSLVVPAGRPSEQGSVINGSCPDGRSLPKHSQRTQHHGMRLPSLLPLRFQPSAGSSDDGEGGGDAAAAAATPRREHLNALSAPASQTTSTSDCRRGSGSGSSSSRATTANAASEAAAGQQRPAGVHSLSGGGGGSGAHPAATPSSLGGGDDLSGGRDAGSRGAEAAEGKAAHAAADSCVPGAAICDAAVATVELLTLRGSRRAL
eukprot:364203-Chlamydomonas_euryale.AAC.7